MVNIFFTLCVFILVATTQLIAQTPSIEEKQVPAVGKTNPSKPTETILPPQANANPASSKSAVPPIVEIPSISLPKLEPAVAVIKEEKISKDWMTQNENNYKILTQQNELLIAKKKDCIENLDKGQEADLKTCKDAFGLAFIADAVSDKYLQDINTAIAEIDKAAIKDPSIKDPDVVEKLSKSKAETEKIKDFSRLVAGAIHFDAISKQKDLKLEDSLEAIKKYFEEQNKENKSENKVELASPMLKKVTEAVSKNKESSPEDLTKAYFTSLNFGKDKTEMEANYKKMLETYSTPNKVSQDAAPQNTAPGKVITMQDVARMLGSDPKTTNGTKRGDGSAEIDPKAALDPFKKVNTSDAKTTDSKAAVGVVPSSSSGGGAISGSSGGGGPPSVSLSNSDNNWRNNYLKNSEAMNHKMNIPKWTSGSTARTAQFEKGSGGGLGSGSSLWGSRLGKSGSLGSDDELSPSKNSGLLDLGKKNYSLPDSSSSSEEASFGTKRIKNRVPSQDEKRQRMDYLSNMAEYNRLTRESDLEQVNRYINIFDLASSIHYQKIMKGETMGVSETSGHEYLISTPRSEE